MSACSLGRLMSPFFSISFPISFLEVGTLTSVLLAIQHTFSSSGLFTIHIDGGFCKSYRNLQSRSPNHLLLAPPHVLQGVPLFPLFVPL